MQWFSVQFSLSTCPTLCDPIELQHVRFPCPSLSCRVCTNSCLLTQWCYPTISFSVALFSCPQSFAASGSFPMSQSALRIRWRKYWSFSFSITPSNEYLGLISCRTDWFDHFAVQGTLKSLPLHNLKAATLPHSAFFMVQLSYLYLTLEKYSFDYTDFCQQSDVSAS